MPYRSPARIAAEQKREKLIVDSFKKGVEFPEIRKKTGVKPVILRQILESHGLMKPTIPVREAKPVPVHERPDFPEQVVARFQNRTTVHEIAQAFDVPRERVVEILKKEGLIVERKVGPPEPPRKKTIEENVVTLFQCHKRPHQIPEYIENIDTAEVLAILRRHPEAAIFTGPNDQNPRMARRPYST